MKIRPLRRATATLSAVCAIGIMLASCGSDDDDAASMTTTAPAADTTGTTAGGTTGDAGSAVGQRSR